MRQTRTNLLQALPEIPAISAVVRVGDDTRLRWTAGSANLHPPTAVVPDQVFDLASLTKALVTTPLTADLVAEGADVDEPVAATLPGAPPGVTVRHLLTHTSGLPAWRPLYADATDRDDLLQRAWTAAPEAPRGVRHVYSDLGFLTLGAWIEHQRGDYLDRLFLRRLTRPLGLDSRLTWGHPDAAATERCPVRGHVVQGEVHDLNAWKMGGVAPHAGLFGDADAVASLAAFLVFGDDPRCAILRRWWSEPALGSHRGGWDTPTPGGSTGDALPAGTVGHLGYTGTSLWVSPDRDTTIVLLTNRVHPTDDLTAIRRLRPAFHRAVAADLWGPP